MYLIDTDLKELIMSTEIPLGAGSWVVMDRALNEDNPMFVHQNVLDGEKWYLWAFDLGSDSWYRFVSYNKDLDVFREAPPHERAGELITLLAEVESDEDNSNLVNFLPIESDCDEL